MNIDQIHHPATIRLLLADDHTMMRQGLRELLQRQDGLTIVGEANNGQKAIELFHTHRPDVLLTDIEMPLMDWHHGAGRDPHRVPRRAGHPVDHART